MKFLRSSIAGQQSDLATEHCLCRRNGWNFLLDEHRKLHLGITRIVVLQSFPLCMGHYHFVSTAPPCKILAARIVD